VVGCAGSSVLVGNLKEYTCDGGLFLVGTLPASQFSGTCNTNLLYSRVGDESPLYPGYGCMTGPPNTYYRELALTTSTSSKITPVITFSSAVASPTSSDTSTSSEISVSPPVTAFLSAVASPGSPGDLARAASLGSGGGIKKLAVGLSLGLGIPFLALAFFFCYSYRRISISVKITAPEPPPAYSDARGGLVPGTRVAGFRGEEQSKES